MGSKLLNGSPQLSVRVILLPLILIVLLLTVTPATTAGTPVIKSFTTHQYTYLFKVKYVYIRTYVAMYIHT